MHGSYRTGCLPTYKDATDFVDWPDTPQPPPTEVVLNYMSGPVTELRVLWSMERQRMLQQGKTALNWQRPAQSNLKPGDGILETGEYIHRV